MLVDEHDTVVMLVQQVRAAELHQRWNGDLLGRGLVASTSLVASTEERRVGGRRAGSPAVPEGPARLRRVPDARAGGQQRRAVQDAERAPNGAFDGALDVPAVVKAHLGLRRMDVDVDGVTRKLDLERERRPQSGRQRGAIRAFHRPRQADVAHRAPIHDERGAA